MLSLAYEEDNIVVIQGKEYEIDLTYDNIIRFTDMMQDETINAYVKIEEGLAMLLDTHFDLDIEAQQKIIEAVTDKYIRQKETAVEYDMEGNVMEQNVGKQAYSLTHDADYIFASFMQAYHIDLIEQRGKLTWEKFMALLYGLPSDTKFKEVVSIRLQELPTGKGTADERKRIIKMKNMYALPGQNEEEGD